MLYCDSGSERVAFVMYDNSRPARGVGDAVKSVVDGSDAQKDSLCSRRDRNCNSESREKVQRQQTKVSASSLMAFTQPPTIVNECVSRKASSERGQ